MRVPPEGTARGIKQVMDAIFGPPKTLKPKTAKPDLRRFEKMPPSDRIPLHDAAEFYADLIRAGVPPKKAIKMLRDAKTRGKLKAAFGLKEGRPSSSGGPPIRPRDPRTGQRLHPKGGSNAPSSVAYSLSQIPEEELTIEVLESLIRNYRKEPTPYIRSLDLFESS